MASGAGALGNDGQNEVRLWETRTGKELRRWDGATCLVSQVSFLARGKLLAAEKGWPAVVRVWETVTGKELYQFGGKGAAWSALSPDRILLALWGNDAVRVWDVADHRLVAELRPEISLPGFGNLAMGYRGILISAQALSPGGRYVACAARHEGGTIHVFKVATGEEVKLLRGHLAAARTPPSRDVVKDQTSL